MTTKDQQRKLAKDEVSRRLLLWDSHAMKLQEVMNMLDQARSDAIGEVERLPGMQKDVLTLHGSLVTDGEMVDLDWRKDGNLEVATFVQDNGKNVLRDQLHAELQQLKTKSPEKE